MVGTWQLVGPEVLKGKKLTLCPPPLSNVGKGQQKRQSSKGGASCDSCIIKFCAKFEQVGVPSV